MTLTLQGTRVEHNEVNAYGSGIFFVSNDHSGSILLDGSTVANNTGGSWYPVLPDISMHADTRITVRNTQPERLANPTRATVLVDGREIAVDAYTIDNSNYFKLRDVAALLDFGVTWDAPERSIHIQTNERYAAPAE